MFFTLSHSLNPPSMQSRLQPFVSPILTKSIASRTPQPSLLHISGYVSPKSSELSLSAVKKSSRRFGSYGMQPVRASLLESPFLWAGRMCVYYALLKSGVTGCKLNSLESGLDGGFGAAKPNDVGFQALWRHLQGKSEIDAAEKRKLVSKWHPTTKGTLKRNYRVTSKPVGQNLLKSIASLLSDDDQFTDGTSHKGCQIRRESAHGQSVCCNNVRALFDELPTPHLVVEITAFPTGPLTEMDYVKAEKLERILRSSPSI